MRNNVIFKNGKNKPKPADNTLKVTALLYFKEALLKEQYENCATFAKNAKKYGALQSEIDTIIADYIRGLEAGQHTKAYIVNKGQPRF